LMGVTWCCTAILASILWAADQYWVACLNRLLRPLGLPRSR
jgi:hypothetical protein